MADKAEIFTWLTQVQAEHPGRKIGPVIEELLIKFRITRVDAWNLFEEWAVDRAVQIDREEQRKNG